MDEDLARSIGERVRWYRSAARRSKAVVAGLTGITPDYLYQIERGQKVPALAVLTQLAEVLGVSAGGLLGGQPTRETARVKSAAGDAIYQALTSPLPGQDEPPALPALRRRVHDVWTTWQSSPRRYSQLTTRLPALIADTERAVRAAEPGARRESQGCAADLYGLLRTVTKRIGRVDLSLLAADRAVRCAEVADDPLRLGAAHWITHGSVGRGCAAHEERRMPGGDVPWPDSRRPTGRD